MKARELDTVELIDDLPEFNVGRGERGVVLDVYKEPEELYDIEFVDNKGASSRFAYLVRPEQIFNIDAEAAELYKRGMGLLNEGNLLEASRPLRRAIELNPSYIRGLHESLRLSSVPFKKFGEFLQGLFLVRLLDPEYEIARHNLAITYLNYGVEEANQGNLEAALFLFHSALRVDAPSDVILKIQENISATYSMFGAKAHRERDFEASLKNFETAYAYHINDRTRHDLALAYAYLADSRMEKDKYEEAIHFYRCAEDTGLINPSIYNNHAVALATLQQFELAIMIFESALSLAPDDETIRANLSNAVGKNLQALKHEVYDLTFSQIPPLHRVEHEAVTL